MYSGEVRSIVALFSPLRVWNEEADVELGGKKNDERGRWDPFFSFSVSRMARTRRRKYTDFQGFKCGVAPSESRSALSKPAVDKKKTSRRADTNRETGGYCAQGGLAYQSGMCAEEEKLTMSIQT